MYSLYYIVSRCILVYYTRCIHVCLLRIIKMRMERGRLGTRLEIIPVFFLLFLHFSAIILLQKSQFSNTLTISLYCNIREHST